MFHRSQPTPRVPAFSAPAASLFQRILLHSIVFLAFFSAPARGSTNRHQQHRAASLPRPLPQRHNPLRRRIPRRPRRSPPHPTQRALRHRRRPIRRIRRRHHHPPPPRRPAQRRLRPPRPHRLSSQPPRPDHPRHDHPRHDHPRHDQHPNHHHLHRPPSHPWTHQ